ncbi:hypothetical protein BFR04_04335 [Gaetbulibacter sp. 4G1]|nr:hypothetical protein [Gaetbulibacter sp. 4G1]PIA78769.1 hypothetical protein BFR04_04335 [Gaetbulibacter sp. 4G1]
MDKYSIIIKLDQIVNITEILIGIFVLIGLYFAIKQFKITKRTYSSQLLIPISNDYKDVKWQEPREYLKNKDLEFNIKEFEKKNVADFLHFFDHVGRFLMNKYFDIDEIYGIMGGDIQEYWPKFEKYINYRREKEEKKGRFFPYGYDTQYLYVECLKYKPYKEKEQKRGILILNKKIKELTLEVIKIND